MGSICKCPSTAFGKTSAGEENQKAQKHRYLSVFGFSLWHPATLIEGTKYLDGFKTTLSHNTFKTGDKKWWMTCEGGKIAHRTWSPAHGAYVAGAATQARHWVMCKGFANPHGPADQLYNVWKHRHSICFLMSTDNAVMMKTEIS